MENAKQENAIAPITEETRKKMARLTALKALLDANKPLYEEVDRLTVELQTLLGVGNFRFDLAQEESMLMHNGSVQFLAHNQVLSIVDNFADKNTVFRPAGVKRFEATPIAADVFAAAAEKKRNKKA